VVDQWNLCDGVESSRDGRAQIGEDREPVGQDGRLGRKVGTVHENCRPVGQDGRG
jgi:hypothetical protein